MKNSQKGFVVPILIIIAAVFILIIGIKSYYYVRNTEGGKIEPLTSQFYYVGESISANPQKLVDNFTLTKGNDGYYRYSMGTPMEGTNRSYASYKNIEGIIDGQNINAVVLSRLTGNNIIQLILFAFKKEGNGWKQVAYANFPEDGGRTTIDSMVIKDNKIVIEVKTSGPERNYHETYVPKTYIYQLSGDKLILEQPSTQTSSQTKDWKTYVDKSQYWFEIKYPNDFIGSVSEKAKSGGVLFYGENLNNLKLEGYFNNQFNPKNLDAHVNNGTFKKTEILVDGVKSYKTESVTCKMGCGSSNSVFIPYKKGAIVIVISRGDGTEKTPELVKITNEENKLLDQIISTFKFID